MTHVPRTLGLPGLSALVVGLARSGAAACSLLRRHGFAVRAVDLKEEAGLAALADRMRREGVELQLGTEDAGAVSGMDFVVLSPGVPDSSPVVREALRAGLPVLGEVELACRFCPGPYLGVTGTNGKTTTATWLAHLLRGAGRETRLAGNVGLPFSEVADHVTTDTLTVLEISSFQMEHIDTFRPVCAAALNVTPDHLDRYPSMKEYAAAKARIFENQGEGDLAVLNEADPGSMAMERWVHAPLAFFNPRLVVGHGAGVQDGVIHLYRHGHATPVLPAGDIALRGPHNLENALAALAMTLPWQLDPARLAQGLREFPAIPHRLEPCGEVNGVLFVNDSKATNLDSMEKALLSFDRPIHLIAGGRDKGADWGSVAGLVKARVRTLLLIGEAAPAIEMACPGVPAARCASLEEAVSSGLGKAAPGDVVLLSPGCASYDMFRDYEERGDRFRAAAQALGKG